MSELARLLQDAGSSYDPAGVEALIEGVLGAPAEVGTGWHVLVADRVSPALADALETLRAHMAAGHRDGLSGEDFTRLPRAERLAALRRELAARGLDGFIVPRSDEHQGEYVPPRGERLAWLTGFTGSAGLAIVLPERAAVFVDGRYTLQAAAEVDAGPVRAPSPDRRAAVALASPPRSNGLTLGYDPWLHTPQDVERFRAAAEKAGATLRAVGDNPLDRVWPEQPAAPLSPAVPHDERFAGISAASKRNRLGRALAEEGIAAVVLTMPESIAWLLNIRGGDVPYTPLPLAFAILRRDGSVALFIDRRKLAPGLERHLGNEVAVCRPTRWGRRSTRSPASAAGAGRSGKGRLVDFRPARTAQARIAAGRDPCLLPKALKNAIEQAGTRARPRRDGAAVTRFLAWLARAAAAGGLTEMAAANGSPPFVARDPLYPRSELPDDFRRRAPNGAIVHYRVDAATNRRLAPDSLISSISGAQYLDGTTDVTRTVAIGTPSDEMRERFTLVLKGHIALAAAPASRRGRPARSSTCFARPRVAAGARLRPRHRPRRRRLSRRARGTAAHLQGRPARRCEPGMILSNEPGYYKTGAYGIRIENLVLVHRPAPTPAGGEMLCFETLTLAPIDRRLIEPSLLDDDELAWLDAYHARVRTVLTPIVDGDTAVWLAAATRPLDARN